MTKTAQRKSFSPLVDEIVNALEDIKGEKITILNLQNLENPVCDYFVICQANSNTQVKALADSVEKKVRENLNERPWHVEGADNAEWILLDYVAVAVHVFQTEAREFYDLEGLWADAAITQL